MTRPENELDFIILRELKSNQGYTSGEELSGKLKISRQALWKHIGKLTDKGYEIVAAPHLGYKLISCPDKFYPWEVRHNLNTGVIGKKVYYDQTTGSTQDRAWQLGLEGTPEGTVVFAETQKKGRGRSRRQWVSPRGGIYFSLILRPNFLIMSEAPQITILIALGCLRGIKRATGLDCSVKWPNDIYLGSKKIGGILCEINAEMDRINFVVAGIGINVNSKDLPSHATSLFLNLKKKLPRVKIAKIILEEIEVCYRRAECQGFSGLLDEWSRFCFLWGKRVKVKVANRHIEGEAAGIDDKGYLLLRKDSGLIEKVSAGDVTKLTA